MEIRVESVTQYIIGTIVDLPPNGRMTGHGTVTRTPVGSDETPEACGRLHER